MTHFTILAMVPKDCPDDDVEDYIFTKLETYSENKEMEAYETECYCVGRKARHDVQSKLLEEFGTMDDMRKKFEERRDKIIDDMKWPLPEFNQFMEVPQELSELYKHIDEAIESAWTQWLAPQRDREYELMEAHPYGHMAEEFCDECMGTGKVSTTSNPDARWDWYVIGGRWDGAILNLQPIPDDQGGFNFGDTYHTLKRNSCTKTEYFNLPKEAQFEPSSILDLDGNWLQYGRVGWWGTCNPEMSRDEWAKVVVETLMACDNDTRFVLLDAHI